ncbi:MAG TPA: DUF1801 domain-containing protein [Candidatus Limnocylindrales bacterium]|nr:DUF1801 domain-containing protein [Candidatus Limnocylindrales bacterium]
METVPPEVLLDACPEPLRRLAEELRDAVRATIPEAIERVRPGWRLIGYDVPVDRGRTRYFCFVLPEPRHVHLGFEYGALMADLDGLLEGAGVTKRVRWLTFRPGDRIDPAAVAPLIREAADAATLPAGAWRSAAADGSAREPS